MKSIGGASGPTAADAGANLPAIKAVTGHKSDAIVGRYLNAHRIPGVGLDSTRQR